MSKPSHRAAAEINKRARQHYPRLKADTEKPATEPAVYTDAVADTHTGKPLKRLWGDEITDFPDDAPNRSVEAELYHNAGKPWPKITSITGPAETEDDCASAGDIERSHAATHLNSVFDGPNDTPTGPNLFAAAVALSFYVVMAAIGAGIGFGLWQLAAFLFHSLD